MPRRTITPAEDGIQAVNEDYAAATEQAAQQEQTAQTTNPMKIDVSITATRNYHENPERARATVTLGDCFVIKGVRVMRGENGLFVSMPARKGQDGQYREMCHPITSEFARQLNSTVLEEYQAHLTQQMEESQQTPHIIEPGQDTPAFANPEQVPEMEMM